MFYRTQIKSVTGSIVVDKDGKKLQFMGYLPVKAGDWVFTDGKFIFGNVPPRGSAVTFSDEPSGVPVLDSGELRGYFTQNGVFKKYRVAQDDWITNSDKKFAHGAEFIDETKVINAGFSERGEKLVATDGIYQDSRIFEGTYVSISTSAELWRDRYLWMYGDPKVIDQHLGSEYFPSEQKNPKIFIDDKKDREIDLEPYAKKVEQYALVSANSIMQLSAAPPNNSYITLENLVAMFKDMYDTSHSIWSLYFDKLALPPPDEPVITYSAAHILTSTVNEDGLDGLIFAAAYGYCFPHIQPRFSETFSSGVPWDYAKFGIRSTPVYLYEWKCVPFGFSAIFQIGKMEPIAFRDFGGINSDLPVIDRGKAIIIDNIIAGSHINIHDYDVISTRHIELLSGLTAQEFDEYTLFPVGEGFYQIDKFGRLTFFDSDKKKIAENIPVHDDFCHIEIEHGEYAMAGFTFLFNDKPHLHCKIYTPDGNVENKVMFIGGYGRYESYKDENGNVIEKLFIEGGNPQNILEPSTGYYTIPPMDGYYIKYPTGICEPLQFTPLFYQFQNGSYLYGVKGGKLYLKPKDGKAELIGDGVKNFRLQELKKISKAKR